MLHSVIEPLVQFGVAGLMGVLWVWERAMSRRRERQLDEAHRRLARQRDTVNVLLRVVRQNTQAIARFEQTQRRLQMLLEKMHDRTSSRAA